MWGWSHFLAKREAETRLVQKTSLFAHGHTMRTNKTSLARRAARNHLLTSGPDGSASRPNAASIQGDRLVAGEVSIPCAA